MHTSSPLFAMLALPNGLDKINIRLRRRQFARRRTRLDDVIAVQCERIAGSQRSLGGPALDLVISGGRALSRGLDQPRDRAAGKKEPASRHMRVTIPPADSVARSHPRTEQRICCEPSAPCVSDERRSCPGHDAKDVPDRLEAQLRITDVKADSLRHLR